MTRNAIADDYEASLRRPKADQTAGLGLFAQAHTHAEPTKGEDAAVARVQPHAKAMCGRILAELAAKNMTPDEFCARHKLLINTVRRRFTDLWKQGRIEKTGEHRANADGNLCSVWRVTPTGTNT